VASNTQPIYTVTPLSRGVQLTAANTRSDGNGTIGTDMFVVFLSDATNASYLSSIKFMPWATVAGTATTGTVIRVYISTQTSGATTSANTFLIAELSAAAQTADSATVAVYPLELQVNRAITAGYAVLASIHAAPAANTGWAATSYGGNY
jgi:hypothetical protein